jgi:hypothetical protein
LFTVLVFNKCQVLLRSHHNQQKSPAIEEAGFLRIWVAKRPTN